MERKDKLAILDSTSLLIRQARMLIQHTENTELLTRIVEESAKIAKMVGDTL
jgi:hypothetical protein